MRPDGVVFLLPEPDDAFCVVEGVELVDTEAFVSQFPVEGLNEPVSPGLPWWDKHSLCFTSPLGNGVADELWPVIHPQCSGRATVDG